MKMGPAKEAKVLTNDSTLGDPAAEELPMKLSLRYPETKKAFSFRGASLADPRPALDPAPPSVPPAPNLPLHH